LSITLFTGSPPAGWIKVASDVMAHMYMGAACTYAGVKIAPAHPKLVAVGIFAIQLIFAGASIWSSFVIYAIPTVLGLLFGGVVLLIATIAGEIRPYGDVCAERG